MNAVILDLNDLKYEVEYSFEKPEYIDEADQATCFSFRGHDGDITSQTHLKGFSNQTLYTLALGVYKFEREKSTMADYNLFHCKLKNLVVTHD